MSQLSSLRPASRSQDSPLWWHLHIDSNTPDVADGIIKELVTPLSAFAQELGVGRWYFGRTDSPKRSQVWVRILGPKASISQLQSRQSALQLRMGHEFGIIKVSHREFKTDRGYLRDTALDPQHEAELAAFGGQEGLDLAQEIFEVASELAAWATERFAPGQNRMALAALLMFDSAHTMREGKHSARWRDRRRISWDFYWDSHLRSCTQYWGQNAHHLRDGLSNQVSCKSQLMHSVMMATGAEAAVKHWRRRWRIAIDMYLHRADRANVSRPAQHLTVLQAHHLMQKLGFNTTDEAILGLYAKLWGPDQERIVAGK